ncbi:unnamed protein product [Rotaria magnacalcarata]|uniref:HAT C-terminal dimerisation domain-containing protein n=2 Tax=Rotaria magnacalcarata TaxID=392030 RepID=A0A816REB6_9BILA|nr:unnamed protein product [Rotaria magnacalcarata]
MRSFLVITGHFFLHNSFDLTSTVLSFSTFNCHHKSIDILRILQDKLKELSILHKVIRVTTDDGRNVAWAVYDMNLNLKRIWCVAHRLHLSITNAFGLWIVRKDDDNGTGALEQDDSNNDLNDSEQEMVDIEYMGNNNDTDSLSEYDDTEVNVAGNESDDNDKLSETFDSLDEEQLYLIMVIMTRMTMNLWMIGQQMLSNQIVKLSTILTLYFDAQRKRFKKALNLCYDVKSRWNSTYCMINSFIVLREIIENLFSNKHQLHITQQQVKKLTNFELASDDWHVLLVLFSILKPFYLATTAMSGRQYPSIGLAYYLLARLRSFLQQHNKKESLLEKRLKQLLLKKFLNYFDNENEQMELLMLHAYFDPAGFAALTEIERRSVEQTIKKSVADQASHSSISVANTLSITTTTANSENKPNANRNVKRNAMNLFNESVDDIQYGENRENESKRAAIINEFYQYRKYVIEFNEKHKPDAGSAIVFWRTSGETFSILKGIAKKMLSTPATSVPSESCFSTSSALARKERARLSGEHLCSSVFLKDKIKL